MLKGILVMSCIRPCVQLFMGLTLCIADKSLGRNGQQIGMLMYPDDNYGYYYLCVCLTVCWCFHLLGLVFIVFSKVRVGAKQGGSHYWEMTVAITCGYGGYLLPLLAAHSSCNFIPSIFWRFFVIDDIMICLNSRSTGVQRTEAASQVSEFHIGAGDGKTDATLK